MSDFDALAATWDDDPAKLERARRIADAIAAAVPLAWVQDALEYGCGTGLVTWALADRLKRVLLADTSDGMLAVAQARRDARPDADRARFTVQNLDLERADLPTGSLDLIYTSMVLHHVSDVPTVLRRFRDALRLGGHLAIADLDHDPHGEFHGHGHVPHDGFDRGRLAHAVENAGFRPASFSTVATVTKDVDGHAKEFPVFLAVTRTA